MKPGGLPRGAVRKVQRARVMTGRPPPRGRSEGPPPRGRCRGAGVSWVAGGGEIKKTRRIFGRRSGVSVKRRGGVNSPFSWRLRCVGSPGSPGPLTMTMCDEAGEDPAAPGATRRAQTQRHRRRHGIAEKSTWTRRGQSPRQPEALPRRISVGGDTARGLDFF